MDDFWNDCSETNKASILDEIKSNKGNTDEIAHIIETNEQLITFSESTPQKKHKQYNFPKQAAKRKVCKFIGKIQL